MVIMVIMSIVREGVENLFTESGRPGPSDDDDGGDGGDDADNDDYWQRARNEYRA